MKFERIKTDWISFIPRSTMIRVGGWRSDIGKIEEISAKGLEYGEFVFVYGSRGTLLVRANDVRYSTLLDLTRRK